MIWTVCVSSVWVSSDRIIMCIDSNGGSKREQLQLILINCLCSVFNESESPVHGTPCPFEGFQVDSALPYLKEACVQVETGSLAIMLELNWQAKSNVTDRGTPGTPFCFTPDYVCISQAAQSIMPTAVECGSTGHWE
jgi:hypothetical protein